jgi:hypothetical protein
MVTSIGHNTIRVTIIYGWDSVARDLGLLTISGIVGKLILRHIVRVTLLVFLLGMPTTPPTEDAKPGLKLINLLLE